MSFKKLSSLAEIMSYLRKVIEISISRQFMLAVIQYGLEYVYEFMD